MRNAAAVVAGELRLMAGGHGRRARRPRHVPSWTPSSHEPSAHHHHTARTLTAYTSLPTCLVYILESIRTVIERMEFNSKQVQFNYPEVRVWLSLAWRSARPPTSGSCC